MGRLAGKNVVITGGSSGIGLAACRRFLAEGAELVIADIDGDAGARVADELGCRFVVTDVTDADQVAHLFAFTNAELGSVDVLFNNAGISPPEDGSILDVDDATWRRVGDVNLTSVYRCCRAVLPYMIAQGGGSIINNASVVAVIGAADQISYTASKGGVLSMSRELAVQYGRHGVRVNALCPGPVNTPLLREFLDKEPGHEVRRLDRIPLGRFAEPDEVAQAALFLASDESSYITATTFMVDGGASGAFTGPA